VRPLRLAQIPDSPSLEKRSILALGLKRALATVRCLSADDRTVRDHVHVSSVQQGLQRLLLGSWDAGTVVCRKYLMHVLLSLDGEALDVWKRVLVQVLDVALAAAGRLSGLRDALWGRVAGPGRRG
jgi:hypothetical protein